MSNIPMSNIQILVYWIGNRGIPGKGPSILLKYDPNQTIGFINTQLKRCGFNATGIVKHKPNDISKYDINNLYFAEDTKLSEVVAYFGGIKGKYIELIWW